MGLQKAKKNHPDLSRASDNKVLKAMRRIGDGPSQADVEFLKGVFRVTPRRLWVPASQKLGRLAASNESVGEWLEQISKPLFDAMSSDASGPFPAVATESRLEMTLHHFSRHTLHLACSYWANGGSALHGWDAVRLLGVEPSSTDSADLSAYLLGLRELLKSAHTEPGVIPHLEKCLRAVLAHTSDQSECLLLEFYEHLRKNGEHVVVAGRLLDLILIPRFVEEKGGQRLDAALAWSDNLSLLVGKGAILQEDSRLKEALERAGNPGSIVHEGLNAKGTRGEDPIQRLERLAALLSVVFVPERFGALNRQEKADVAFELLLLLKSDGVKDCEWDGILKAAVPGTVTLEGKARAVGRKAVALELARNGIESSRILRDEKLTEEQLIQMASLGRGTAPSHLTIEAERLLRDLSDQPLRQLGLLWKLWAASPNSKIWKKLPDEIRGRGDESLLRKLVLALLGLQKARDGVKLDSNEVLVEVVDGMGRLAEVFSQMVSAKRGNPVEDFVTRLRKTTETLSLLSTLDPATGRTVAGRVDPCGKTWMAAIRDLYVGTRDYADDAAEGWLMMLGGDPTYFQSHWDEFEYQMEQARFHSPLVSDEIFERLERAFSDVRADFKSLSWPAELVLSRATAQFDKWLSRKRAESRRSLWVVDQLDEQMQRGDEASIVSIVDQLQDADPLAPAEGNAGFSLERMNLQQITTEDLALLPEKNRRVLADFLRRRLMLFRAAKVRTATMAPGSVATTGTLWARWKTVILQLSPMLLGVLGGVFLVLDVGGRWTSLVGKHLPRAAISGGVFLLLGWMVLFAATVRQALDGRAPERVQLGSEMTGLMKRSIFLYALLFFLAVLGAAGVQTSLDGLDVWQKGWMSVLTQLLLWGSLSSFLGLFVGLVMQDKKMTREE